MNLPSIDTFRRYTTKKALEVLFWCLCCLKKKEDVDTDLHLQPGEYDATDNGDGTWTWVIPQLDITGSPTGGTVELTGACDLIAQCFQLPDGSALAVDPDTGKLIIPISGFAISNDSGGSYTVTHTAGDGTAVAHVVCNWKPIVVDGVVTGMQAYDSAGAPTGPPIPLPPNPNSAFTFVNNGDGTYSISHTAGDGTVTGGVINVNEIDMDINSVTQAGSVLTFTAEDGTAVNVDICAIVAGNCNSAYVLNPDGSATFTDNAGDTVNIPAPASGDVVRTAPDGSTATVPADDSCYPLFGWQRVTDHHGTNKDAADCADKLLLHRSLTVTDKHTGSTGLGDIAVASEDSDDADTGVVTNHHRRSVQASTNGRASRTGSFVVASQDSEANANYSAVGASQRGVATLPATRVAIYGSKDTNVYGGQQHFVGGCQFVDIPISNYTGFIGSTNITILPAANNTVGAFAVNGATIGGASDRTLIAGSGEAIVNDSTKSGMLGTQRCEFDNSGLCVINGSTDSAIIAQQAVGGATTVMLSSRYTEANGATGDDNATVWGWSSMGPRATANRTGRFKTITGTMEATGTYVSGVAFPGLAEVVPNATKKAIPVGTIVAWVGRSVRPALVKDELGVDGVARFGVVKDRTACAFLAGDTPFTDEPRYKTGEFGELLYEDIANPDLQPIKIDVEVEAPKGGAEGEDAEELPGLETRLETKAETTKRIKGLPKTVSVPIEDDSFADQPKEVTPRSARPKDFTIVEITGQAHAVLPKGDWAPGDEIRAGIRLLEITNAEKNIGIVFVG